GRNAAGRERVPRRHRDSEPRAGDCWGARADSRRPWREFRRRDVSRICGREGNFLRRDAVSDRHREKGTGSAAVKYSVITFGCRVSQADSLAFEEGLRAGGCVSAEPDQADVVVVNTCSVTSSADQSARQIVRRVARQNPSARIIVTGCYATRRPDELAVLPQ